MCRGYRGAWNLPCRAPISKLNGCGLIVVRAYWLQPLDCTTVVQGLDKVSARDLSMTLWSIFTSIPFFNSFLIWIKCSKILSIISLISSCKSKDGLLQFLTSKVYPT